MNKEKLKSYAPQARKNLIAAITARANLLGLSEKAGKLDVVPSQAQGDVMVIAGQAWPIKQLQPQREQLIKRIQKDGFEHTMEAVASSPPQLFAVTGPSRARLEPDAVRAFAGPSGNSREADESRQAEEKQPEAVPTTA